MIRLTSLIALLLTLCLASTASAGPCSELTGADKVAFDAAVAAAESAVAAGDTATAVEQVQLAETFCDGSGALDLALATAYEADKNCHMARYAWERLLERADAGETSADANRSVAAKALAPLEASCPESALVTLSSELEAVSVVLKPSAGSTLNLTPPFEGRIPSGAYTVTASKEGYDAYSVDVDLRRDGRNAVYVPQLIPKNVPPQLNVRCAEFDDSFELGADELDCHYQDAFVSGPTTVIVDVEGNSVATEVTGADNAISDVRVPVPLDDEAGLTLFDWGFVLMSSGLIVGGAGLGLHLAATSLHNDVENPLRVDAQGNVISLSQRQADDVLARADAMNIAGISVGAVGGAIFITGLVLLFIPEDPYSVEVAPSVGQNDAMLHFKARF